LHARFRAPRRRARLRGGGGLDGGCRLRDGCERWCRFAVRRGLDSDWRVGRVDARFGGARNRRLLLATELEVVDVLDGRPRAGVTEGGGGGGLDLAPLQLT